MSDIPDEREKSKPRASTDDIDSSGDEDDDDKRVHQESGRELDVAGDDDDENEEMAGFSTSTTSSRRASSSPKALFSSSTSVSSTPVEAEWMPTSPANFLPQPWTGANSFVDRLPVSLRNRAPEFAGIDWLEEFLSSTCVKMLVTNTNKYVADVLPGRPKPSYWGLAHWPPKWTTQWQPVTEDELWVYVGISMLMGVVRFPRLEDYWTEAWPYLSLCSTVLSRNRFQVLRSAFHFTHLAERPNDGDALWKVRPLLNELREACQRVAYPGKNVSLDEMMINCQAKTASALTQTVKGKPTPFGILVRAIVDYDTKYLRDFVFVQRGTKVEESAYRLVLSLPRAYHNVFTDNLYTKPAFALRLLNAPFPQYGSHDFCLSLTLTPQGVLFGCLYHHLVLTLASVMRSLISVRDGYGSQKQRAVSHQVAQGHPREALRLAVLAAQENLVVQSV